MSRPASLLLLAAALYGGALVGRPAEPGAPADTGRHLVRPLMLPFLWLGLEDALARGSTGAHLAQGRTLLRLLPGWIDGHVYFASRLVLDGRSAGDDAGTRCDRLFAALAWLEEVRGAEPDRESDLLASMASLVEISARDPGVAAEVRARQGRDAAEIADELLAEVPHPSRGLAERRLFLTPGLMASALRTGDRERFEALLELALQQAGTVRDAELAARFTADLQALRAYWRREIGLQALVDRPYLVGLLPFLEPRMP